MKCVCCGRRITDPASVRHGMGPVCYARREVEAKAQGSTDRYDLPFDPEARDIVVRREGRDGERGVLRFNFAQALVKHSPTGMGWGYGGSGPADFAINALLRVTGDRELATDPCYYQAFKAEFVAALPHEGGTIRGRDVAAWLEQRRAELTTAPLF